MDTIDYLYNDKTYSLTIGLLDIIIIIYQCKFMMVISYNLCIIIVSVM